MRQPTDASRLAVVRMIANGHQFRAANAYEYMICGKRFHVKVKNGNLAKYPFNIKPTVLRADFEVVVCGKPELYYCFPQSVMKLMNTDPHAMPDNNNPGYNVYDIHPRRNEAEFRTLGGPINIAKYRNATLNGEGQFA